jgi:hypothetical protein
VRARFRGSLLPKCLGQLALLKLLTHAMFNL